MPSPTVPDPPSGLLCPACGNPLPKPTGRAGRPADTCDAECREVWKLVRAAEFAIGQIQNRATPRGWLDLRGRLWRMVNDRAWNRGLKVTDTRP